MVGIVLLDYYNMEHMNAPDAAEVLFSTLEPKDESMRDAAEILLEAFEASCNHHSDVPPNLILAKSLILVRTHENRELLPAAVWRMYKLAPDRVLSFMRRRVFRGEFDLQVEREIQWAVHIISIACWRIDHDWSSRFVEGGREVIPEARTQLLKLANIDAWWVNLYAAIISERFPELSTPEVVETLMNSKHELVLKAMAQKRG